MGGPFGKLLVAVEGKRALIRACGRASFTCSADFKRLVYELLDRGAREFVLELSECTIMDSTFLGILVRFAGKLSDANGGSAKMVLQNASPRIMDLITSLGMEEYFKVAEGPMPGVRACKEINRTTPGPGKAESTRVALEAHETLMQANPDNVERFKDVTRFLAEDLKKMEQ